MQHFYTFQCDGRVCVAVLPEQILRPGKGCGHGRRSGSSAAVLDQGGEGFPGASKGGRPVGTAPAPLALFTQDFFLDLRACALEDCRCQQAAGAQGEPVQPVVAEVVFVEGSAGAQCEQLFQRQSSSGRNTRRDGSAPVTPGIAPEASAARSGRNATS